MSQAVVQRRLQIIIEDSGAQASYNKLVQQQEKLTKSIEKGQKAGRDMTNELTRLEQVKAKATDLERVISGKVAPSFTQVRSAVQKLRNELALMSRDAPGYAEKFNKFKEVSATFDQMRGKTVAFRDSAKSVFSGSFLGTLAAQGVGFLANALGNLGQSVLSTGVEFEKFETILTNTLGSRSQAKAALDNLVDFAARTPFQLDELTGSYIKLVNRGFKPTTEELTKLGDLAASQGKGFEQLTEAILDAQTAEFERLKEFGIRASKAGDTVTLSFKNQTVAVKATDEAIREAIINFGALEGVAGGMAAQAATTGGQISNLKDQLSQMASEIFTLLKPAIDGIVAGLSRFVEIIRFSLPGIKDWAKTVSDAISDGPLDALRKNEERVRRRAAENFDKKMVNRELEPFIKLNAEEQKKSIEALEKEYNETTDKWQDAIQQRNKNLANTYANTVRNQQLVLARFKQAYDEGIKKTKEEQEKKRKEGEAIAKAEAEKQRKAADAEVIRQQRLKEEDLKNLAKELAGIEEQILQSELDPFARRIRQIAVRYQSLIERAKGDVAKLQQALKLQAEEIKKATLEYTQALGAEAASNIDANNPNSLRNRLATAQTDLVNARIRQSDRPSVEGIRNQAEAETAVIKLELEQRLKDERLTDAERILLKTETAERIKKIMLDAEKSVGDFLESERNRPKGPDPFEEQVQKAADFAAQQVQYAQQISDVLSGLEQIRLQRVEENYQREANGLQNLLNNKLISQEEYTRRSSQLEAKMQQEKAAIAKREHKRNQSISIAQITIDAATAAIKLWAKPGFPANIPLLALLALQTAAGIGKVLSTPPPQFAKGGILPHGPSHQQGGMAIVSRGRKVAEIEGGEPIINKNVYRANKYLIDSLLAKGHAGDYTAMVPKWYSNVPSINIPRLERTMSRLPRYATGGILPEQPAANQQPDTQTQVMQALLNRLNQPIMANVVYGEYELKAKTVDDIRFAGTIS